MGKTPRYDYPTRVARKLAALAEEFRGHVAAPRQAPITSLEVSTRLVTLEEAVPLLKTKLATLPGPVAKTYEATAVAPLDALIADQQKWMAQGLPSRTPITEAELQRRATLLETVASLIRTNP